MLNFGPDLGPVHQGSGPDQSSKPNCGIPRQIKPSGVPTDHWLVKVKFAPRDAPYIGNGRWTWPLYMLENKDLMNKVVQRGIELETDLASVSSENMDRRIENPQTLWSAFKEDIAKIAKDTARKSYYKLNSRIEAIEKDLHALRNSPDYDANKEARTDAAFLTYELEHLAKVKVKNQRNRLCANLANHGERLGGIWSSISREKKPCDLILRLKVPGSSPASPLQYERCTKRMAKLVHDFHENLQNVNTPLPLNEEERENALEEVLQAIPEAQRLPESDHPPHNWNVTEEHIQRALELSKDGTAAGLDGCPNELWKALNKCHKAANKINKRGFNIVKALTILIQDI